LRRVDLASVSRHIALFACVTTGVQAPPFQGRMAVDEQQSGTAAISWVDVDEKATVG
jgi:hypothetical protein